MSSPINGIQGIAPPQAPELRPAKGDAAEFTKALDSAVSGLERSLDVAEHKTERMLSGRPEELHSVVMATQRAGLELELFLEVRNKVIQAYQEVMRAQV